MIGSPGKREGGGRDYAGTSVNGIVRGRDVGKRDESGKGRG